MKYHIKTISDALYILSKDEIKINDLYYNSKYNEILIAKNRDVISQAYWKNEDYKILKVIASYPKIDNISKIKKKYLAILSLMENQHTNLNLDKICKNYKTKPNTALKNAAYRYNEELIQKPKTITIDCNSCEIQNCRDCYENSYDKNLTDQLKVQLDNINIEELYKGILSMIKSDTFDANDWIYEVSSGYRGYRSTKTSEWLYEDIFLRKKQMYENYIDEFIKINITTKLKSTILDFIKSEKLKNK